MILHPAPRVREIYPHVYMFSFENQYDVNMHFLRYQEFYESPNPDFRNATFNLVDYMRWYSIDRTGAGGLGIFSYPNDWSGFNVPCWVFSKLFYDLGIPDENIYDRNMREAFEAIKAIEGDHVFYIVGCVELGAALEHELAHGLWYVSPDYQAEMRGAVAWLKHTHVEVYNALRHTLVTEGYCADVVEDEINAYIATGFSEALLAPIVATGCTDETLSLIKERFTEIFARYSKDAQLPWIIDRAQDTPS